MLFWIIFLFANFSLLVFFRHLIAKQIFILSLITTGSHFVGLSFYSLLFLPGTIIHELAHALTASFLQVPVGNIHIFPQLENETKQIKLGTAQIGKSDFIRTSIIGAAPTIIGALVILGTTYLAFPFVLQLTNFSVSNLTNQLTQLKLDSWQIIAIYTLFTVSSTMHTSASDRQSWPLLITLFVFLIGLVYLSNNLDLLITSFAKISQGAVVALCLSFSLANIINLTFLLAIFLINQLTLTITNKKIAPRS